MQENDKQQHASNISIYFSAIEKFYEPRCLCLHKYKHASGQDDYWGLEELILHYLTTTHTNISNRISYIDWKNSL